MIKFTLRDFLPEISYIPEEYAISIKDIEIGSIEVHYKGLGVIDSYHVYIFHDASDCSGEFKTLEEAIDHSLECIRNMASLLFEGFVEGYEVIK